MRMVKISRIIKEQTEPWSSSGANKLAANFNTAPIMCVDSSTASLTNFTGSELILLRPPVDTAHSQARRPFPITTFPLLYRKIGKNLG